ncbi:thermonuclease family protein [Rhodococcus maanshanensis]|uniref:Micrococcal nuclease n=1 Tax=Rhodococcus maanshanensis TaxID=183556 RepID=A0A1H7VWR4_9NOCA|nr:thermonuclease family protein [Rhodococcus maanshanensis]SEM13208.1 micrococcal nuclease [Rhodococcus maanshanensis]
MNAPAPRRKWVLALGAGAAVAVGVALVAADRWTVTEPAARVDPRAMTVEYVYDGDTVRARDGEGELTVRVLGIDTPETVKAGYTVGCWGPESTAYARAALDGVAVRVSTDPQADSVDDYGRTLAYLTLPDGSDYGTGAVRAGMAKAYPYGRSTGRLTEDIARAEGEARAAGAGLWGPSCAGITDSAPQEGN